MNELARERLLSGFTQDAASDPLPELSLRRPELFAVLTDYFRRTLALAFLRRFGGRSSRWGAGV